MPGKDMLMQQSALSHQISCRKIRTRTRKNVELSKIEKRTRHKEDKTLAAPGDHMANQFEGMIQHQ
jgi:ribosomal protein L18E